MLIIHGETDEKILYWRMRMSSLWSPSSNKSGLRHWMHECFVQWLKSIFIFNNAASVHNQLSLGVSKLTITTGFWENWGADLRSGRLRWFPARARWDVLSAWFPISCSWRKRRDALSPVSTSGEKQMYEKGRSPPRLLSQDLMAPDLKHVTPLSVGAKMLSSVQEERQRVNNKAIFLTSHALLCSIFW